jgi:hypothetical protein
MMQLPEPLELKLLEQVETLERNNKMPYVTSVERIGIKKGVQEGAAGLLLQLIEQRFGSLDESTRAHITQAEPEQLSEWSGRLFDAPSLNDILH